MYQKNILIRLSLYLPVQMLFHLCRSIPACAAVSNPCSPQRGFGRAHSCMHLAIEEAALWLWGTESSWAVPQPAKCKGQRCPLSPLESTTPQKLPWDPLP